MQKRQCDERAQRLGKSADRGDGECAHTASCGCIYGCGDDDALGYVVNGDGERDCGSKVGVACKRDGKSLGEVVKRHRHRHEKSEAQELHAFCERREAACFWVVCGFGVERRLVERAFWKKRLDDRVEDRAKHARRRHAERAVFDGVVYE